MRDAIVTLDNGTKIVRNAPLSWRGALFAVWEPSSVRGPHSSITTLDGQWYGQLGTRRDLPANLAALPGGTPERIAAVRAWYAAQADQAYALIVSAFPEAASGKRCRAEIELPRPGSN